MWYALVFKTKLNFFSICESWCHTFHIATGTSCSEDKFACAGGGCVSQSETCDGEKNCEDGSDEPSICGISFIHTVSNRLSLYLVYTEKNIYQ